MSNSPLINYTKISPNSDPRKNATYNPTGKVTVITIHHAAGNISIESMGEIFAQASREASSNYGIGTDGRVALYVNEDRRPWTSGSRENDYKAVTIEVANDGGAPEWHVSDKALAKLIDLCADICQRNGIERLNFTGDKTGNLTMHKWFQATGCPGPYLGGKFPYIAQEVNKRLGEKLEEAEKQLPRLKKGSKGESVKALQLLLIGRGYSCGSWGADGDFGAATESALARCRMAHGLTGSATADQSLWAALLGVKA